MQSDAPAGAIKSVVPIRPSRRLRAIGMMGGSVLMDQVFVAHLLDEVAALERAQPGDAALPRLAVSADPEAGRAQFAAAGVLLARARRALDRALWILALSAGFAAAGLILILAGSQP